MKKSKEKLNQKGIKMNFSLISLIVVDVFLLLTIIVPYIRKRVSISHFVVPTLLAIIVIMFLEFCFTKKTIEGIDILCTTIAMLIYVVLSSILVLIQTGKEYEREYGKGYDQKVKSHLQEIAIIQCNSCYFFPIHYLCRLHHPLQIDKVYTTDQQPENRHNDIRHQRRDNLAKCSADNHTDSHIHHISLHCKCFKILQKLTFSHLLNYLIMILSTNIKTFSYFCIAIQKKNCRRNSKVVYF